MHSCLGLFEKFHTVKSILALSTSSNSMSENTCFVAQTGLCEADSTSVENVRLHLEMRWNDVLFSGNNLNIFAMYYAPLYNEKAELSREINEKPMSIKLKISY